MKRKQEIDQRNTFNRKSISRNATLSQS